MNSSRSIRFGPAGGRVWYSAAYQGWRRVICRVCAASSSRSARQSGPGLTGRGISAVAASSIRSTSPSLLCTYRYSAIAEYGPSRAATAFMVSAPAPASSARPIAAVTISARPRDRCRGGGGGWAQMSGAGQAIGLRTIVVYYINSEFMSETLPFEPEGIRLGVVRGISYGLFGPPGEFVPQARALGAGLVRAYLY